MGPLLLDTRTALTMTLGYWAFIAIHGYILYRLIKGPRPHNIYVPGTKSWRREEARIQGLGR